MQPIYLRGGHMAKSKFDMSLLKPINSGWDETKLKPLEEEEEIPYTPPPPRTGWSGILSDIGELPGKALDYAMELPGQAASSAGQIYHKPGRALMNLLAGAGELGEGFLNTPHEAIKYLGKREVIPEWLKKYNELPFTHIPNLGIEEAMGLDKTEEGDQFLRQLPTLIAGGKALKSMPGVKGAIESVEAQAKYRPLKKKVGELAAEHETATGEHKAATEEYNALKNFLEGQMGYEGSNPNILERKAAEAQQKLGQLKEQSAAVPENFRASEEPMAPEKTPLSLVEPIKPGEKAQISEEPLQQAESLLKTKEQKAAEQEAKISQHLGEGNAHRKRVAEKLNPILEKRQAEIGKGYDEYVNSLKDKQVTLSNPRDAKSITADIQKRLMEGDTSSKEMIKLTDELANLGKGETMPADKFVSAYRSLRGMEQKTRSSAYGKSPQEFDRLTEAADSMKKDLKMMEGIIDTGLGEENLETLRGLNHRYATEVAPLFKNKFFQYMQTNNKAPSNMIEQLTNEPYVKSTNPNKITGTQILNEIIRSDPELLQNVVGERFAHKPEALHQWDEAAHQFIQHMPELQELRNKHFLSKQEHAQSKLELEAVKQRHQMQREQADIAHRKETEKAREQTRQKKAEVHKENQTKQKEHEEKTKYFKMQKEIKELDEKSAKLTEHAKKIREKADRKDITLKQKLDFEHELTQNKKKLAQLDKERKRIGKIAKGIGVTAAAIAVGTPIYRKAKSMIGGLK
jgi:hypothetical protein